MNDASAKIDVMAAIKRNLAVSERVGIPHQAHNSVASGVLSIKNDEPVIEIFCSNLEEVGGKCAVVTGMADAKSALRSIVRSIDARRIAISDSPMIRSLASVLRDDIEVLFAPTRRELFDCDVGITEAQWAIAETGTLVLDSGKESHRLTSLVPGVHICLLSAENIHRTMRAILQKLEEELNPLVTFITGPSRTSDIELTLAIGVHGPRELYVIVLDETGLHRDSL